MTFDEVVAKFDTTKKTQTGWMARCPAHDDGHASLHISEGESGTLLKCHAGCEFTDIIGAVGLRASDLFYKSQRVANGRTLQAVPPPQPGSGEDPSASVPPSKKERSSIGRIEGRYSYHNAERQVVYEVVRYGPDKTFRQRSLHGGEWKWTMEGVEKVLYNLPEVLQAHKDATIWVVEGEKDADNLRKQGLVATCNVGGAGKWRQEYCEALRDRIVVVIADNDVPGQRHAGDIDRSLQGIARSVTVLNLPNLPEKGDVTDWLAINGNDAERLCQIADDLTVLKSKEPDVEYAQAPPEEGGLVPSHPSQWRRTQEGLAIETLSRIRGEFVWVHDLNPDLKGDAGWARWDDEKWVFGPPAITAISDLMRSMTAEYRQYARELLQKAGGQRGSLTSEEKGAFDFATQLESNNFKNGWKSELKTFGQIHTSISTFDASPWLLTVENGVLDLKSAQLLPFKKEFFSTKRSMVRFDPLARCPRWEMFLQEVFSYNAELIEFIQRSVGYSLTGDTSEQCIFLCHGSGANGKSVFLDILLRLLGEFGMDSPMSTFSTKAIQSGGAASNDLAMMRGARLVTATETNEGMRLDEALVKKLSGGDRITARKLYQDFFTFIPSFKVWFALNHKPTIRGVDNGIWRRMTLIPFERTFRAEEQDRYLKHKLIEELPGILNWALRGCLKWQEGGLMRPQVVDDATNEYRQSEDTLQQFIDDECIVGEHFSVASDPLYQVYRDWATRNNEFVLTNQKFGKQLTDRGFGKSRGTGGRTLRLGIGLLAH